MVFVLGHLPLMFVFPGLIFLVLHAFLAPGIFLGSFALIATGSVG